MESKLIGTKSFKSELVLERSWTPFAEPLGEADNTMEFYMYEDGNGHIIWDYELPEEDGQEVIGLLFDGKELTDYDGLFELPVQAIELIEECGFDASYAK